MSTAVAAAPATLVGAAATRARAGVSLVFFVNGAAFASWVSRIPALRASMQLSDGALGSVLFALSIGVLLSFPLAGRGAQWLGPRTLGLLAGVLVLVMLPAPFLVGIVPSLVLVLLEMGLANGMMQVSMNVMAAEVETRMARPIMSSLHGAWSAGGLAGAGLGSLAAHAHLAPMMHLVAVALLLGAALATGGSLTRAAFARGVPAALLAPAAALEPDGAPATPAPARARRVDGVIVGLGTICFCAFLTEGALADWSAVYLRDVARASEGTAALGYAVFAGAMTTMRFAGDRLLARVGRPRLLRALNAVGALALAAALAAARTDAALAAFALMGLGLATVVPSAYSATARHAAGSARGVAQAVAVITGFGYTGLLVGPPVLGWLAQAMGLREALALLVALTALIAGLSRLFGRGPEQAPLPEAANRAAALAP
ncbi:MAG: MFS transporter [Burkholderiaceae bacterium]